MDSGLIPQRYAKALYKYAKEQGDTKKLYELSKRVIASFEGNPELQKVLSNPYVKLDDKERLLMAATGHAETEDFARFVKLIAEHKRMDYAYAMMLAYRDIYRKENHISQAHITTATKLAPQQMEKLREIVKNSFKGTKIEFSESVNPSLIGGFVIDVDSVRLDASVNNELEQLRQTLLRSK